MGDLLAHDEVFEQRRPAVTGLEGVLVVSNAHALVGPQSLARRIAAHSLEALQFGIGIGLVGRLGTGGLALFGRVRFLAGHGRLSSSVFRLARVGLF
ncbi:hypothetical protein D3C80_1980880 [compost metagenome]